MLLGQNFPTHAGGRFARSIQRPLHYLHQLHEETVPNLSQSHRMPTRLSNMPHGRRDLAIGSHLCLKFGDLLLDGTDGVGAGDEAPGRRPDPGALFSWGKLGLE